PSSRPRSLSGTNLCLQRLSGRTAEQEEKIMPTASLVRTHEGHEIPEPGTYAIDTTHSTVEFVGRHLGFAKVRGRFTKFEGQIEIADVPEQSSVAVEIDVASVDSAEPRRDEHLRSED